ncbi:hypothetical protein ES703_16975 [subsurface metagenome]
MELVKHEACQEYLKRRLSEGWKCISLEGYNAVLLSPSGMRRELDLRNDVETLRPNGAGDLTEIHVQEPDETFHWDKVDEVTADGNSTMVYPNTYGSLKDLYALPDNSGGGTINKITLHFTVKSKHLNRDQWGLIKSDSTITRTEVKDAFTDFGDNVWGEYTKEWVNNPADSETWEWADINALQIGVELSGHIDTNYTSFCTQVYVEVDYTPVAPTVITQTATYVEDTTAMCRGYITNTGGENCDKRGMVYDLASHGNPGNVAPGASGYADFEEQTDSFGTGSFTRSLTSLSTGRTYYARAYAHNSAGYSYGGEASFLTKPAAPTNVAATDGDHTDKVVVTWTKSTGATGYKVYEGANLLDTLGDVATYDDTDAPAPTITPGNAAATDGLTAYVTLSLSGESANNGAPRTYKVVAFNATGDSDDSSTNAGYRGVGALTYQWQISAADSDADYGNISGGTTEPYNHAVAHTDGRYYRCVENATGATQQISAVDRGWRAPLAVADGDLIGIAVIRKS